MRVDQPRPYVVAVVGGQVRLLSVTLGRRGEAALAGGNTREPVVEIVEGAVEGSTLLRGSVGTVREGTPARLLGAPVAAASAAR